MEMTLYLIKDSSSNFKVISQIPDLPLQLVSNKFYFSIVLRVYDKIKDIALA